MDFQRTTLKGGSDIMASPNTYFYIVLPTHLYTYSSPFVTMEMVASILHTLYTITTIYVLFNVLANHPTRV